MNLIRNRIENAVCKILRQWKSRNGYMATVAHGICVDCVRVCVCVETKRLVVLRSTLHSAQITTISIKSNGISLLAAVATVTTNNTLSRGRALLISPIWILLLLLLSNLSCAHFLSFFLSRCVSLRLLLPCFLARSAHAKSNKMNMCQIEMKQIVRTCV